MRPDELGSLRVGQRVVARDAGKLRAGTVEPVPRGWRRCGDGDAFTSLGPFPKVWVRLAVTGDVLPWPAEDVFTNTYEANEAVAAHERASR